LLAFIASTFEIFIAVKIFRGVKERFGSDTITIDPVFGQLNGADSVCKRKYKGLNATCNVVSVSGRTGEEVSGRSKSPAGNGRQVPGEDLMHVPAQWFD